MIYFIQVENNGPIKIGFTANQINQRLQSLQTSSPNKLDILGCIDGEIDREKLIHEKFKEYHIRNEWFIPAKEIIRYIISNSIEPTDFETEYPDSSFHLKRYLDKIERNVIKKALAICKNNRTKTADYLQITRITLIAKIKKYNL